MPSIPSGQPYDPDPRCLAGRGSLIVGLPELSTALSPMTLPLCPSNAREIASLDLLSAWAHLLRDFQNFEDSGGNESRQIGAELGLLGGALFSWRYK